MRFENNDDFLYIGLGGTLGGIIRRKGGYAGKAQ
jgi:hypothetical protein